MKKNQRTEKEFFLLTVFQTHSSRVEERQQAAHMLCEYDAPIALPFLKTLAQDREASVRKSATVSLGELAPEREAFILLDKLSRCDKDPDVRLLAAEQLGRFGESALLLLQKLAKNEDDHVRAGAALGLAGINDGWEFLKELADDPSHQVQFCAVEALSTHLTLFVNSQAENLLRKIAQDPDRSGEIRNWAQENLTNASFFE